MGATRCLCLLSATLLAAQALAQDACKPGFTAASDRCVDIKECADPALNKCHKNAICTDTEGSFTCTCKYGFSGSGTQCIVIRNPKSPKCRLGYIYVPERNVCRDENECENVPSPCGSNSKCTNVFGGFRCVCDPGTVMMGGACVPTKPIVRINEVGRPSRIPEHPPGGVPTPPVRPTPTIPKPDPIDEVMTQTSTSGRTTTVADFLTAAIQPTTTTTTTTTTAAAAAVSTSLRSLSLPPRTIAIATGSTPVLPTRPLTIAIATTPVAKPAVTSAVPAPAPAPSNADLCKGLTNADGVRVRREWRELTAAQKQNYIDAVREVIKRGEWKKVLWVHEVPGTDDMVHASNHFLHWHRYFTLVWENQLRALGGKFSCVTIPYWDWTMDVKSDPFALPNITVVNDMGGISDNCLNFFGKFTYGQDDCLTRPFKHKRGWRPPGPIEVANGIISPKYFYDMSDLHKGWHAIIHNRVGGTLQNGLYSANEPLFFLHHSMVDKLFATWQACHDTDRDPGPIVPPEIYEESVAVPLPHKFDTPLAAFKERVTPRMVNDIDKLGYTYSVDRMELGSSWAPLGQCRYRVPWYSHKSRRDISGTPGAIVLDMTNATLSSPIPFTDLFDKNNTEEKEILKVAKTAERIYNLANDALGTKDNVAVLELATKLECEKFQTYGLIDEPWARMLKITNYTMPCYKMLQGTLGYGK